MSNTERSRTPDYLDLTRSSVLRRDRGGLHAVLADGPTWRLRRRITGTIAIAERVRRNTVPGIWPVQSVGDEPQSAEDDSFAMGKAFMKRIPEAAAVKRMRGTVGFAALSERHAAGGHDCQAECQGRADG